MAKKCLQLQAAALPAMLLACCGTAFCPPLPGACCGLQSAGGWPNRVWALPGWLAMLPVAARPGAAACLWPDGADLLPVRDASALPLPKTGVPAACAAPLLGDSAGCCSSPSSAPPQP